MKGCRKVGEIDDKEIFICKKREFKEKVERIRSLAEEFSRRMSPEAKASIEKANEFAEFAKVIWRGIPSFSQRRSLEKYVDKEVKRILKPVFEEIIEFAKEKKLTTSEIVDIIEEVLGNKTWIVREFFEAVFERENNFI